MILASMALRSERPPKQSTYNYDDIFRSAVKEKARFDGVSQVEPDRRGFKLASIEFHEHLRYDDVMQSTMHDVDDDDNEAALPSQVAAEEAGALYMEVSRK